MKKLILKLNNGKISLIDAPNNKTEQGYTKVKNLFSVVSPGTEKMLINFGRQNFFSKVLNNFDKVSLVIKKIYENGLFSTLNKVQNKLNLPIELGYSTCSEVIETSSSKLKVGDLVVTNGPHADYSLVKNNLCIKVENINIDKKYLSYSFIASISINAFIISQVKYGHKVGVIGLGIIGVLLSKFTISELINVTSFDISNEKVNHYKDELNSIKIEKDLKNIDANFKNTFDVIYLCVENITSLLFYRSCELLKKNGKLIIVGTTKAIFPRDIIYKKNLDIKVSVSYGPGRYDDQFELGEDDDYIKQFNHSYLDNIKMFIEKLNNNKIHLDNVISQDFNFNDFEEAYESLMNNSTKGIIFNYRNLSPLTPQREFEEKIILDKQNYNCDIVGTGNHSANIVIPKLIEQKDIKIANLVSKNGISSNFINESLNLKANLCSIDEVCNNKYKENYLFIITSHETHFQYLEKCIGHKKKIFLEKPLCEKISHLNKIKELVSIYPKKIHINFNRRYSKIVKKVLDHIDKNKFTYLDYNIFSNSYINIEKTKDSLKNMIIGEFCHFIDLAQLFINNEIINYNFNYNDFNLFLKLEFKNGNFANINFFSIENNNLSKEYVTIINGDNHFYIDNFQKIKMCMKKDIIKFDNKRVDKGFKESIEFFFKNNISDNYLKQVFKNTEITIDVYNQIRNNIN